MATLQHTEQPSTAMNRLVQNVNGTAVEKFCGTTYDTGAHTKQQV